VLFNERLLSPKRCPKPLCPPTGVCVRVALPQLLSVLQRIHINLLTRRNNYWSRPVRRPLQEQVACFSDPGIILEQPHRRIFASWICSGSLVEARPPVSAVTVPRVPICTDFFRLFDGFRRIVGPNVVCISLSLEYLQRQPPRSVVRDMAMHQPASWVVSFKGDDNEAVPREQNHITPRRIYQSEIE
jgi:hypothetical protein